VLIDVTGAPTVIGEVDVPRRDGIPPRNSTFTFTAGSNITFDISTSRNAGAYVKRVDVDTTPIAVRTRKSEYFEIAAIKLSRSILIPWRCSGASQVVGFKKIKFFKRKYRGDGKLANPLLKIEMPHHFVLDHA